MTAREILIWPIERLQPYGRNSRTHSPEQVEKIVALMNEFGWTQPILADKSGSIVAGHGRRLAAMQIYELGGVIHFPDGAEIPTGHVPVIDVTGWSETQRRAYVIADNQSALAAGWDNELLALELGELRALDFDLSLTAFDDSQIAGILDIRMEGETDPDDVPEPQAVTISRRGDVWILGRHRLVCGDSTDPDDVQTLLNGARPHLMVTDPPYGVEYDPSWRNSAERSTQIKGRKIGATAVGKVLNDDRADWTEAWELFPGDVAYVWHGGLHTVTVAESLVSAGFAVRSQIVWAKQHFVIGRGDYHWQHEPCWYAVRKGATGHWSGDRSQSTVWNISNAAAFGGVKEDGTTGHGTQKPIDCMKRPIENNSKPGDAIYEPFSGSGSTIIACEITGRAAIAIELNPVYVDVAVRRWQAFTGLKATLEATGETFDDVAKASEAA